MQKFTIKANYGLQYEIDNGPGELATGVHQERFQSVHDRAARRCFNRRVQGLRASARKKDGPNLVRYLKLFRINRQGNGKLLLSCES